MMDEKWIRLDDAPDGWLASSEMWKPESWEALGYQRHWGDAAVSLPHFEILRKEDKETGYVEFVILCPTFLRRPLVINAKDLGAWGSY